MSEVFGSLYADAYDALYQDKDYESECDLLQLLFQKYATGPIRTILDLGCGTGKHSFSLAGRGFELVGIDRSQEMIARAQKKLPLSCNAKVSFQKADIRKLELGRLFDACLMMFAVLGYQTANADVLSTLGTARRNLRLATPFVIFSLGRCSHYWRPLGFLSLG